MDLHIILPDNATMAQVLYLKNHIQEAGIEEIEKVDIERKASVEGGQGLGMFVSSILAVVSAAKDPLTELIKCLNTFIETFKTEIEIQVGDKKIKLSGSHPEKMESVVKSILESINKP